MRRQLTSTLFALLVASSLSAQDKPDLFAPENLMAWCIVPFDAKKRGPEERAEMLERLKIPALAYDWRAEHIPQFDAEIAAMKKRNIAIKAWWFPAGLNSDAQKILDALKRSGVKTQLWITMGQPGGATDEERASNGAKQIAPIANAAKEIGCDVALYNHGGWFGEPANQMAIIRVLNEQKIENVGIVYNFHHGHAHIQNFKALLDLMKPKLLAINLNGMELEGDKKGKKIYPVGKGDQELAMLKTLKDSGWQGPVGILCHRTDADAEVVLKENLEGLNRLREELKK